MIDILGKHLDNFIELLIHIILLVFDIRHLVLEFQLVPKDKLNVLLQSCLRVFDIMDLITNLGFKSVNNAFHSLHYIFRSLDSALPFIAVLTLLKQGNVIKVVCISSVMDSKNVEEQI